MTSRTSSYCIVTGCSNKQNESKLSFFKLPIDCARRNEWLKNIGRPDLLNKSDLKPLNYKVCSIHFQNSMISDVRIRKLLPDAVPTPFLSAQPPPSTSKTANKSHASDGSSQTKDSHINTLSVVKPKNDSMTTDVHTQTDIPVKHQEAHTPEALSSVKMPKCHKIIISSFDFLQKYANYPCLWNKCHPKFGDEVSREAACLELTSFLQTDDPMSYLRKLKCIENKYYRELTQSFSVLKSNPNAKLTFKPWVELAKRFFGDVSHNSYEVNSSVSRQAKNDSSTNESVASTSSFTEILKKKCLDKPNLAARVDQSISSQVEDGIDNPLNNLHTCIDIKEEFNDAVNIRENARLEDSNAQYEPSHIQIEEPMDETAMAVNAITAYDEQISPSSEPFIKVICASTNSPIPAHGEENISNNTDSKKRPVSSLSSSACAMDEMTEDRQSKVAKKNSSNSRSDLTNESVTFGQYTASQMQLLPLSSALQLQCDIHNLIVKARLEHENENK